MKQLLICSKLKIYIENSEMKIKRKCIIRIVSSLYFTTELVVKLFIVCLHT